MTSFALKIIAVIAMTIDHAHNIIGQTGFMTMFPFLSQHTSYILMRLMYSIGRMAFPMFAFMIAEGASKTRSMPRYIGRLVMFALISEPIFYFSHWHEVPTIEGFIQSLLRLNFNNVFFTLALGTIAIYVLQLLERRQVKYARLLFIPILLSAALLGGYIGCDYRMAGVLLIGFLFLAQTKPQKCLVILVWIACLYGFGQAYNPIGTILRDCLLASLSCVFIWFYNGQRGRSMNWSFYIYYPAHLLVLSLLGAAVR